MNPLLKRISLRIFKDRIKPFIISYFLLLIVFIIISHYALKDDSINFFYNGLGQLVIAITWLLLGIEHFLLKKKKSSFIYIILSLLWIYLAIQSFHLSK